MTAEPEAAAVHDGVVLVETLTSATVAEAT
jgi:hypothetical protein